MQYPFVSPLYSRTRYVKWSTIVPLATPLMSVPFAGNSNELHYEFGHKKKDSLDGETVPLEDTL